MKLNKYFYCIIIKKITPLNKTIASRCFRKWQWPVKRLITCRICCPLRSSIAFSNDSDGCFTMLLLLDALPIKTDLFYPPLFYATAYQSFRPHRVKLYFNTFLIKHTLDSNNNRIDSRTVNPANIFQEYCFFVKNLIFQLESQKSVTMKKI